MNIQSKIFAFLMTRNVSLEKWDKIGMLEREIKPYRKLAEFFKEVYIFTYGGSQDLEYAHLFPSNVFIVSKPEFIPSSLYSFLLPVIHWKILKNIQILKTNQMDGAWTAVFAKKLFNLKLVVRCGYEWLYTIEQSQKSYFKRFFAFCVEKFTYKNADRIILTSNTMQDFVVTRFNVDVDKIQIIPNYIDTNIFKNLNMPKEKNRIIFVGRLEKEKNLINLFNSIKGEDLKLVVIGEGSLRSELEQIARENKIDVEFKGNVPQKLIPEELNKSTIYVLPSLYEGNPKALLEAMACGLPCIGTDVGGINTVVTHMENGLLAKTDALSIREAITLLLGDKELCDKLGSNARKNVESNNSLEVFLEKELLLFNSL